MLADLIAVSPLWGNLETAIAKLPDEAFETLGLASKQRDRLLRNVDSAFNVAKAGAYAEATRKLQGLKGKITGWIVDASQAPLIQQVDKAIALLGG
jgi:hypothetical protein